MYTISTLTRLRRHLGLADTDTADDRRLLALLQAASLHVERLTGRHFCPRQASILHTVGSDRSLLILMDDLLALESVTDHAGVIPSEDIVALPAETGETPASMLLLTGGRAFVWDATPAQAVGVTGTWGWHDTWSRAWESSGDAVQDDPLPAGATTLTAADADGADALGESPRFQVGQLLAVEGEYLRVLAVDTDTDEITVKRGVAGTSAAEHAAGTPIHIYQPPRDVEHLVLRWAAWLYRAADRLEPPSATPLLAELAPLRRARL